jgi:hypothetical protein
MELRILVSERGWRFKKEETQLFYFKCHILSISFFCFLFMEETSSVAIIYQFRLKSYLGAHSY